MEKDERHQHTKREPCGTDLENENRQEMRNTLQQVQQVTFIETLLVAKKQTCGAHRNERQRGVRILGKLEADKYKKKKLKNTRNDRKTNEGDVTRRRRAQTS